MPTRWNSFATIRREQIENGLDPTFTDLFLPWYREHIAKLSPGRALEVGAGTGHLAKMLTEFCGDVVALEPSSSMYAVARETLANSSVELVNKTIQQMSDGSFDLVLSHMCFQVIDDLQVALNSVRRNLSDDGTFLMAIPHPCFYNDYKNFFPSEDYRYMTECEAEVSFTVSGDPTRPISGVPYHHRPLSRYTDALREAKMVIRNLHEIFPDPEVMGHYPFEWHTPRYIVIESIAASSLNGQ